MCENNLTLKFPPDFHNYTGLNRMVNSFSWFTITPPNKLVLGCKLLCSAKRKKTYIMWEMVAWRRSAKRFSLKFLKIHRETPVLQSLSNAVVFRPSGLQLYWRETPSLVFKKHSNVNPIQNRYSRIIHKIHRKTLMLESLFK